MAKINLTVFTASAFPIIKGYGLFSYGRYATDYSDRPCAYLNLFLQISIIYHHLRNNSLLSGKLLDRSFKAASFASGCAMVIFTLQHHAPFVKWIPSRLFDPIDYVAKRISNLADSVLVLDIGMEIVLNRKFHTAFLLTPLMIRRLKMILSPIDDELSKITWWVTFPYFLGLPGAIYQVSQLLPDRFRIKK